MRTRTALILAILGVAVAVLSGCGKPAASAKFAPLADPGKTVTLGDFKGKAVLIEFWATWCAPCRLTMPQVQKIYDRYGKDGLEVVALSTEDAATVSRFRKGESYTYPVYLDLDGGMSKAYGADQIPLLVVLDRNGREVGRILGAVTDPSRLTELVEQALRK